MISSGSEQRVLRDFTGTWDVFPLPLRGLCMKKPILTVCTNVPISAQKLRNAL
jgi:hypothetical protein